MEKAIVQSSEKTQQGVISERRMIGHLALLLSAILMGSAYVGAKLALQGSGPLVTAFFRFVVSSLIAWPILLVVRGVQPIRKEHIGYLIGHGLFQTTFYFALQYTGLQYTTTANTSLIVNTRPLILALMALIIFRERFSRFQWGAFLLSFAGVLIILYDPVISVVPNHLFGDFLIVLNALSGAIGVLFGKRLLNNYKPFTILVYQITIGGIGLFPFAWFETKGRIFTAQVDWLAVIFLAIVCTVMAQSLFNFGLAKLPVSNTAVYFFIIPVVNVILANLIFDEPITVSLVIGGIMIIVGTYFVGLKKTQVVPNSPQ